MNQIGVVFRYTFMSALKKKAFRISTVIILVIITILFALPRVIDLFSAGKKAEEGAAGTVARTKACYYVDETNAIAGATDVLAAKYGDTNFIAGRQSDTEAYREEIKNSDNVSMIVVTQKDGAPFISVTMKDFKSPFPAQDAADTLSKTYVANTLAAAGVDAKTAEIVQTKLPYENEYAGTMSIGGYTLGLFLTILLFFVVYYYGYGVAMSIATEKASRVMETLVVSAKPSRILLGKCLAMGVLGLLQFAGILMYGTICYLLLIPKGFMLFGAPLSLSSFTFGSTLLVILYFILGYALYSVMNSVCGALVSKIEDLNAALMPVMLITILAFYFAYFMVMANSSNIALYIAMYLPFSAPFIMPFKILNGGVGAGDILISVVIMIAAIIAVTAVSMRIYAASVLHYGKKMTLREMYKKKV